MKNEATANGSWTAGDSIQLMLSPNERQALKLLEVHTGGTFDFQALAGDSMVKSRGLIIRALIGGPAPRSHCGITNIRDKFYKMAKSNIKPEGCAAQQQNDFQRWAATRLRDAEMGNKSFGLFPDAGGPE